MLGIALFLPAFEALWDSSIHVALGCRFRIVAAS